jgi:tetratricopeptide (TPR) repeat protein
MIRRSRVIRAAMVFVVFLAARAQTTAPPSSVPVGSSQEPAVIDSTSTKIAFDNDGNIAREQTTRVLVQTDAGVQRWGLLTFPFQSATQTVEIDYVRVRKPDGTTLTTPPDNVQDLDAEITRSAPFYSDLREKHVAVKGLGKGDTLEYQAHWHAIKPLIPGQFWFQYSFQHTSVVLDERIEIKVPAGRAVKAKGPQATQTITAEPGYRVYTWTFSQPQKPKPENTNKKATEAAQGLLPPPDVQISSFQTWEDVGRWYWNLQKDRVEPTPAIRTKSAELTKGLTDDAAKLRAIYGFVGTHYRYVGISFGIGRYQPHAAEDVLTNNYGDCKDKHTLLSALLQASGIVLYPAFISSSYRLDPDVPSPAQFDHIIGYLPRAKDNDNEKDAVWLDTTPEVAPFGYLVPRLRDKQALVMLGDKPAQLIATPADPPVPNSAIFKIDAKLSDNGTLDAKMERTGRGDTEVVFRSAFRSVGQSDWKELMQRVSYGMGYAGTVSDVNASPPEAIGDPFHISYSYNRKDYPDWTNHHITAPPPAFSLPPVPEDDSLPKEPVWLGSPIEISAEATIELPKGYLPQLPSEVNLKYDFAEYHSSYSQNNGSLMVRRRLITKTREISVAQLADYKAFNKRMLEDANNYIETASGATRPLNSATTFALKGAEHRSEIEALPDSGNPDATLRERDAMEAMRTYDVTRAEDGFKKAIDEDPKFTRAWLRLASLYLGLGATNKALETFQKAVDSDPSKSISHKILAMVLMQMNRQAEAITAWQDLLKIAPDDHDAAASLGPLLVQQKRYSEALHYLETTAQKDNSSPVQVRLGTAYLRSGQSEKGAAILEKVLDSDASPLMWNDVAYELAEDKVDLPKALEYAQKAVDKQEKESYDVELSDLLPDDLTCTVRIGYFWDTLGWVHFRLGHLDAAENYLHAAWLLTQLSVNADHLGQLYEQQGKREKAIHMYRLALAAPDARFPGGTEETTRQRLQRITGVKVPTAPGFTRDSSGAELSQLRTVKLKRLVPGSETAEFFLLFSPGAKVEDTQFISGSEKLKSAEDVLSETDFQVAFPKGSSARLVRRAIVNCSPVSGCQAVLLSPDSVKSVN